MKSYEIENVYQKYHRSVNMSYSELLRWSRTKCSRKASLDRRPIKRNLKLLGKPRVRWTAADAREANKTIAFVARMKAVKDGKPVSKECPYSKRIISLKNWAYNPLKKKSVLHISKVLFQ